jgi:hypothetical protein
LGRISFLRASLVALVCLTAAIFHGADAPDISMSLVMKSFAGSQGEVFYRAANAGYSQTDSVPFPVAADGKWHVYTVSLPTDTAIDRIRIDPGNLPGQVSIRSIQLTQGLSDQRLAQRDLMGAVDVRNQIKMQGDGTDNLSFVSFGNDPYFDVKLPQAVEPISTPMRFGVLALAGLLAFTAWMSFEWLWATFARPSERLTRLRLTLAREVPGLSDPALLQLDYKLLLVVSGVFLAAFAYVAMALNQSSLGIWETVYPTRPVAGIADIGTPKRIRSDEWKVMTPWVLNQIHKGSPLQNPDIGGESSPVLASVPIDGVLGLPQFKYAGFRFLGMDRGMSWWWAYKSFALWLSVLWLCLLLTRGSLAASMIGATWVYFSSFTQWWFSSALPEIMTAFAVGVIGAIYALFSAKRPLVVGGCALVVYAAANLALNLYPPFILTLGYLGGAILIGYALEKNAISGFRSEVQFRAIALVVTAGTIGVYGWAFWSAASDSIAAVINTVYPGKRIAESGGVPVAKLLYGFFEPFRVGEQQFPLPSANGNACEASSFVLLAPLALLLVPWRRWTSRQNALLTTLAAFCVTAALWVTTELPSPVERLMQAAGWSAVTPKRTILALGVASVLLCVILFARIHNGSLQLPSRRARPVLVMVTVACLGLLAWWLRQLDPIFFSLQVITMGVMAGALMASGIVYGKARLMIAGLAIYVVPAMSVNPLERGIAALSEKPILLAAVRHSQAPDDKWLVVGDNFLAQGLRAHGLNVFGGSQYLPDRASLTVLDPSKLHQSIWNRYATIRIVSVPTAVEPQFRLTRGDQYAISLNICNPIVRQLGITLVAYTVAVPELDLACLHPLSSPPDSGVQLFRFNR